MTHPLAGTALQIPAGRCVVGASQLHSEVHDAEHLLTDLLAVAARHDDTVVACTHVVRVPWPHEAVSFECAEASVAADLLARLLGWAAPDTGIAVLPSAGGVCSGGPWAQERGAVAAAQAHAGRTSGRAVVFPGQERLVGEVPLAAVTAETAIDTVTSMSGVVATDAVLVTRGFVRPTYDRGALTLRCLHEDAGRLIPWEPEFVHRCGGH